MHNARSSNIAYRRLLNLWLVLRRRIQQPDRTPDCLMKLKRRIPEPPSLASLQACSHFQFLSSIGPRGPGCWRRRCTARQEAVFSGTGSRVNGACPFVRIAVTWSTGRWLLAALHARGSRASFWIAGTWFFSADKGVSAPMAQSTIHPTYSTFVADRQSMIDATNLL